MPLYRVTTFKRMPDFPLEGHWTNSFYINLGTKSLAADAGEDIAAIESLIYKQFVQIYKVVAQQPSALASSPVIRNIDVPGTQDVDPVLRLPRFNTVRITLTDDVDKPSQLYLRPPLCEEDVESGALTGAFHDDVQTNFVLNLLGVAGLRSNNDAAFTTGNTYPGVQMRQIGWKRRSRAGYHRGWVPD